MNYKTIRTILEKELESKNLIFPFVNGLTSRERLVLELRNQIPPRTLEAIGANLNISRERVNQIENKAKEKIAYQKEIIEVLAKKLGEYLFDEDEIERTFLNWFKGEDVAGTKIEWQNFNKKLWKLKKSEKET